jgi:hypothetical protein
VDRKPNGRKKKRKIKRLNWTSSSWQIELRHVSFCETFYFFFFLLRRCGCCCCNVVYLIWQNENAPIYLRRKKTKKKIKPNPVDNIPARPGSIRMSSRSSHPSQPKLMKIQRAL